MSETAVEELKTRHAEEIEPFIAAYNDAVHEHQLILWYLGLISAGLVFGWLAPGAKRSLVSPAQEGLFVAAWTTVFSVAVLGLLTVYVMNGSPLSGIALGITFAITGRPVARSLASVWKVTFGRDSVAIPGQDEAEGSTVDQRARLAIVRTAGISEAASAILWMVALFTLLFALVRFERLANPLVPGFFVAGVFCAKAFSGARPESKQGFSGVMVLGPLPTLAALAMLSIDLLSATLIVPALIALIVGSDARWFGAATGMRLTGARWMPALWFSTPLTDAGAMMLASGFLFWRAGWLDQPLLIAAIVGALICEFTVTLRPRLLERLSDSLDEEEQDEDEGADRTGDESEQ